MFKKNNLILVLRIKFNFYVNFVLIILDNIIFGQSSNIFLILVTLIVIHFEISGKDDNDEHPLNI